MYKRRGEGIKILHLMGGGGGSPDVLFAEVLNNFI